MNMMTLRLCLPALLTLTLVNCSPSKKPEPEATPEHHFRAEQTSVTIGGAKVVRLSQPQPSDTSKPQIVSAEILPGRGMNTFSIKAYVPGKGVTDVLVTVPLNEAAQLLNGGPDDPYGNGSYKYGGAILVPFANRIRGKLSPDGKTIETTILGKTVHLNANSHGKKNGAELHAMHGLILDRAMDKVDLQSGDDQASVTAEANVGDFGGHWLSKSNVTVKAALKQEGFFLTVTVKNVGDENEPVGIGWHPYFALPSGNREQAKLHIPAKQMAQVNNYDDVFPTGRLLPMKGKYAFNQPGGLALDGTFLDDCFVGLDKDASGHLTAEIIDPSAKYGLRVIGLSPHISAFQAYAPVDKQFVAFEPQFNWGDPFGKEWKGKDTGMVMLHPGQSVDYSVELRLFVP
jgi:aldose 1-epimerase